MKKTQKERITDKEINQVLKLGIELRSIRKATLILIKEGKISKYCTDAYFYRISEMPEYKEWLELKKAIRVNNSKLAFVMGKKNYPIRRIAKALNIDKAAAYYLVNPDKRTNYKKNVEKRIEVKTRKKALALVDDWNKYNIENRYPTDETIKAFEFLNLTPPGRS